MRTIVTPKSEQASPKLSSKFHVLDRAMRTLEIGGGILGVSMLASMFLAKRIPLLEPFAKWTIRIFIGSFVLFIAGAVIFSIIFGARAILKLYIESIVIGGFGLFGRIVLAALFIFVFGIALLRVRW